MRMLTCSHGSMPLGRRVRRGGSLGFNSPEKGDLLPNGEGQYGDVDAAADVFALAVTVLQVLQHSGGSWVSVSARQPNGSSSQDSHSQTRICEFVRGCTRAPCLASALTC